MDKSGSVDSQTNSYPNSERRINSVAVTPIFTLTHPHRIHMVYALYCNECVDIHK